MVLPFLEHARKWRFTIALSDVTLCELLPAPPRVMQLTQSIPDTYLELVSLNEEQDVLAQTWSNVTITDLYRI